MTETLLFAAFLAPAPPAPLDFGAFSSGSPAVVRPVEVRPTYAAVMKRVEAGERVRITLPGDFPDAPLWYVGTYDCWMESGRPVMKEVWSGKSAPGVADPPLPFPLTSHPTTSGTNAQEVGVVVASIRSLASTVTVPTITPAGDVVLPGGTSYYCPPWG